MEIKEQQKDPYASVAEKTKDENKFRKMSKKDLKKKLELQFKHEKEKENKVIHKIVFPNIDNL